MELPSSLRGSRKKGGGGRGGGGEVKKNAKGIGEDPFSPLPSSPSLSTPTAQGTALSERWTLYPVLLVSHRSSAGFVQILGHA